MALAEAQIPEWTLGERLAKARKVVGLTQKGMAEKMDVSASAIAKWESGNGEPQNFMDTIDRWSEITGVDPAWLLGFRTGSFSTPLEVITNSDQYVPLTLPFDRRLEPV